MKTKFHVSWMAALLLGAAMTVFAQGPLAPPGPPAPTMKTLVEMEPRTHIVSLPYTITTSGSYYLTTNLNGGGAAGIIVQASGVTIDLRGFSILNCTVGISAAAGVKGVAVHNGMVRGCTGTGIDLGTIPKCRLEDVIVCNNGGDGASVGPAAIVTLCTAVANGARGLALDNGGKIVHCVAQSNSNSGIVVTSNCQVNDNTCERNGAGAGQAGVLTTGRSNRLEGNSCNDSAGHGFKINGTGNLVIRNNACGNAAGDYSVGAGNNYGQVLIAPGAAFVNSNPWANFSCGTPPNGPCTTDSQCNDGNACTRDSCNIATGQCSNTPIPGCSEPVCGNGVVEAGETCDDGNTVNGDGCSATCQVETCTSSAQCNDSNPCTTDACVGGVCTHTAVNCNDNNPCTTDGCDAMNGACYHTPIAGCGPCMGDADCNDGNPCTSDFCQAGSCVHPNAPNGTACSDGNVCTTGDACVNGNCTGTPKNCDDGNACTTDTCDTMTGTCVHTTIPGCGGAVCGNGILESGETCDDGNVVNGDGCSSTCQSETCVNGSTQSCYTGPPATLGVGVCRAGTQTCSGGVWGACTGQVTPSAETCNGLDDNCNGTVDDGLGTITCGTGACQRTVPACVSGAPNTCTPGAPSPEICGNGIDDNCNGVVDEGCASSVCGNGIVEAGEQCDDGNTINGDGCTSTCTVQPGFQCTGSPSVCFTVCGDGLIGGTEQCDDANTTNGDGCSATCTVEAGYQCSGVPSVCTPVTYALTVTKSGAGAGTVTSTPAGINCGSDCNESYSSGTLVTLAAAPASGSTFAGWSGACSGTGGCTVTMNAAKTVTATFTLNSYTLTTARAGSGSGAVTSSPAGISCGATCAALYNHGTMVALTASPGAGSTFTGWNGGGCTGTGGCTVTMTNATTVTATFTLNSYILTVSKSGAGTGTVTSNPAGINCGVDCTEPYNHGTTVTLTAAPAGGSTFAGWSGACSGTGSCNVSMTSAASVTASFSSP